MTSRNEAPVHPGGYVREHLIPDGMSVKDAAKLLSVGRPALSNFLNGNSALSAEMAVRLHKAFGADQDQLLGLQAAFDQYQKSGSHKEVAVRAFVPSFLVLKARQIIEWVSSQIEARNELPVLLRKLIHSTCSDLRQVDFPGYDNAQRKGSDGVVVSDSANPWVPDGKSYWEFGTDKNPSVKAESDYKARLKSIDPDERKKSIYIFVTPHNWHGKAEWEKKKNTAGDWKLVRALDANDIEQWLEQSVPAQIWLAERLGVSISGYETLDQAWSRWAHASNPHLSSELFSPAIAAYRDNIKIWLSNQSERPFIVAADSRDEALAFLACVFDDNELHRYKDLTAIFSSPKELRILVSSSVPFIPIVYSEETERELSDAHHRLHCIILRPRNAVDKEANVTLDLLRFDAFEQALISMGIDQGEIDRLSRESGRSPTILRRRLSENSAIKTPAWSGDNNIANTLVPMALIGAWHAESEADREIISLLAGSSYEDIEKELVGLLHYDDCPVWSAGRYRGVASKVDAIFSIARVITADDLDQFFIVAEYVLSESDPAYELPEGDRWAAEIYGKKREHSAALRKGICETLVILAVHGNDLFQDRTGIDLEGRVSVLTRRLLTPLTLERFYSHDRDLRRYAEASPEEFLRIIEEDLSKEDSVIYGLLEPVDNAMFGVSPARTGILWALECLAWSPRYLPRVSLILAQLSQQKIDDNWMNKPDESLQSIYRSWMPQTAASVDERIAVLKTLSKRFPNVVWDICIEQFKPGSRTGHYSNRPTWRSDASGAGQVVTYDEIRAFNRKALDMLFAWQSHNENTLGDFIECLQAIPEDDQNYVWKLIDEWSVDASEEAKALLRERIRRFAFTRRGRNKNLGQLTQSHARKTYEALQSDDPVIRHAWLFVDHWVQESADELEDEEFDFQKRDERIDKLRRDAIAEIWTAGGFQGLVEFLDGSRVPGVIGHYTSFCISDFNKRLSFIEDCLSVDGENQKNAERFLQGFLSAIGDDDRCKILRQVSKSLPDEERKRLYTFAPFQSATWRLLDELSENVREGYWAEVFPAWGRFTSAELTEIIDQLLNVGRPRAAFHAVHMDLKDIETSRLKRLMRELPMTSSEPPGNFKLDRHYISSALNSLDGRAGVTRDEMAQLEFLYIDALDHSDHGIPNIESQIAESPMLFVQALAIAYKRSDDGEDPPEWKIEDAEHRSNAARAAMRLLDQVKNIPGRDKDGILRAAGLTAWLNEAREICREYGRSEIGDHCLGQLLSRAPTDDDGSWPCQAVCESMEEIASPEIGRGFCIGVYNSRGAHWRGEGGDQERALAAKYRDCADRVAFDYPYVQGVMNDIASSYEKEAKWHDSKEEVGKRIQD